MLRIAVLLFIIILIFLVILASIFYIDYRNKKREYELKKYKERHNRENND